MNTYHGRNGQRVYTLGKKLKSGGEGAVYEIIGNDNLVAKVYHQSKYTEMANSVENPREYLYRKMICMLDNPIDSYTKNTKGEGILTVAWPQDVLIDSKETFVGFTMPKTKSPYTIHVAYRPIEHKILFKSFTWKSSIAIAYNLASVVSYLHHRNIIIGDFNSNNIHIDSNGLVTLIDADSFNVVDKANGYIYKCMVGVPETLAPELQGRDLSKSSSVFTKESDCFSLAIHIFMGIMNNTHPFGCEGLESSHTSLSSNPVAARIARGDCPYVSSAKGDGQPTAPDIEMLPLEIRNLFDRVFTYTAKTACQKDVIARRPSAQEWAEALQRLYLQSFKECPKDSEHLYLATYDHCPWCALLPVVRDQNSPVYNCPAPAAMQDNNAADSTSSGCLSVILIVVFILLILALIL